MESHGRFRTGTRQSGRSDAGRRELSETIADQRMLSKADTERGELAAEGTSVRVHWCVETLSTDTDDSVDGPAGTAPGPSGAGADSDRTALIRLRLHNPDPVEQRIRVRNRLRGPVLFPRRQGVPEAGWDREGFVGTVPATGQRGFGYACPAPVETPPISLEAVDEPVSVSSPGTADTNCEPARVVRAYGDGTPPGTVVAPRDERSLSTDGREQISKREQASSPEREQTAVSKRRQTGSPDEQNPNAAPPPVVTAWLDEIESQIVCAEGLEGPELADVTAALTETGGLDPALERVDSLPDDAATLREVAARATALAERAEDVDVPAESLRRLT